MFEIKNTMHSSSIYTIGLLAENKLTLTSKNFFSNLGICQQALIQPSLLYSTYFRRLLDTGPCIQTTAVMDSRQA